MSRLRRPFRKGSKGALLQNRKGTTLRQDLGKGAADIKTAFKKIKDAGKSLTRGTKDLTATRVSTEGPKQDVKGPKQGPKTKQFSAPTAQQAGDKLINASKIASGTKDTSKGETDANFTKTSRLQNQKDAAALQNKIEKWKAREPKMSDFRGTGRRTTPNERKQYNKALEAWRASKPK